MVARNPFDDENSMGIFMHNANIFFTLTPLTSHLVRLFSSYIIHSRTVPVALKAAHIWRSRALQKSKGALEISKEVFCPECNVLHTLGAQQAFTSTQ